MSAIQNLSEPWKGHTHKEVEDFVKSELEGGGGAGGTVVEFMLDSDPACASSATITSISMSSQDLYEALLAGPVVAKLKMQELEGPITIAILPVCYSQGYAYVVYNHMNSSNSLVIKYYIPHC